MPRRAGSCVGPVGQQTAVDGLAADRAEREAVSGRHAMSEARLEKVKVSGSTTGVHLAKGRPGGEPSDLWDELPELLRFRSSSDCTFGCILLRIKFCIPLITFLHVSPLAVCDFMRLLRVSSGLRPARLVSFQRTNRTEYLRNVWCVWRYGLNKEPRC
jgi:hypothetical protein